MAATITQIVTALFDAGDVLDLSKVQRYANRLVTELNATSRLLRARSQRGALRLCHGDLHLRNIVLSNGRPMLFDAIEFDDGLATVDVLNDLAFLLMDLWHRDLKAHANLCFGTYVSKAMPTEVLNGLAALPIFLSARAAIRAVVAIDKLAITDKAAWDKVIAEINQYIELAESFLRPASPVLIAIGGLSGTGKTTVSAALAPHIGRAPGALHMRSDVERKRLAGIAPLRRLPTQAYSVSASDKVYKHLCDRAATALKAGHAVIVDAVFLDPHHRRMIEQVAAGVGVPFYGIWLEAPQDTLIERVAGRMHDASDADVDVVMGQLSQRSAVTCWESVDAGGQRSIVVARVKKVLPITSCADGVANSV